MLVLGEPHFYFNGVSKSPTIIAQGEYLAGELMERVVVLDTETTGLDPASGDRIIEFAGLELERGLYPTGKAVHHYFNPEDKVISSGAFSVHGISNQFLKDKPLFSERAEEIWEFIHNATLVIHNAAFDMKFLNAEFSRLGYPEIPMTQTIDTLKIARRKLPGKTHNLDALCRHYNISLEEREKHGAMVDIKLLASVYIELTQGGRQQSLLATDGTAVLNEDAKIHIVRKVLPKRELPSFDVSGHEMLMQEIKNNLWRYES